jgi:hypothetical protein
MACNSLVEQVVVHCPLSTAIVYQSLNCYSELINMGADLFLRDVRGNNVLHLLVYVHKVDPTVIPQKMYDIILKNLVLCE